MELEKKRPSPLSKSQLMNIQEQNVDEGVDRISPLPDCLLHHILSFLPTREVPRTSVLSQRWEYLWTSIPSLNFDYKSFFPETDILYPPDASLLFSDLTDIWSPFDVTLFMNFIEKVILMRDEYSSLDRFHLSSRICFSATSVYDWIKAVIKRNVRGLDLSLIVEQPFILPTCVFRNPKIRYLKLRMNIVLHLPPNISLPSLKMLRLHHVTLPSDNMMQSLFSGCPSLAQLTMIDCDWRKLRSISISMPSLQVLAIYDFSFLHSDDLEGCKIRIDAGNLRFFQYTGNLQNEINLENISSLTIASTHMVIFGGMQQEISERTAKLFRGLIDIPCLGVCEETIKYLYFGDNVLPTFRNLKFLKMEGKFGKHAIELLMKFLLHLPKLETLCVRKGIDKYAEDCTLIVGSNSGLSSLRAMIYHNLQGTNTEICFLKFLLQNASVLEKMNLLWSTSLTNEPTHREEIKDLLEGLCRGSNHCVLTFT